MSGQSLDDALEALIEASWIGLRGATDQQSGQFDMVRKAELPEHAASDMSKRRGAIRMKLIRGRLSMTQEEFAVAYHIPVDVIESWESLTVEQTQAEIAFLSVIQREPVLIKRALADEAA